MGFAGSAGVWRACKTAYGSEAWSNRQGDWLPARLHFVASGFLTATLYTAAKKQEGKQVACLHRGINGKGTGMKDTEPKKASMAGGIFMAIGMLGGAIVGIFAGQPSAGMVIGLALGGAAALYVWYLDRSK